LLFKNFFNYIDKKTKKYIHMTFSDLGLGDNTLKALGEMEYKEPTPIQAEAIPVVLMGRDIVGLAQTGTGKTASFTLPMIDMLSKGRAKARMPRSLILSPTRELAAQTSEAFEKYGKYHKLSKALLIGGERLSEQQKRLDKGVDVLIATPGRLIDIIDRGLILLNDVKFFVIDEADKMLDMGFIPDIEKIANFLPRSKQTLMFSATMPKEIERLAQEYLNSPSKISVAPTSSAAETIEQRFVNTNGRHKKNVLRKILCNEQISNCMIFCNTKKNVASLVNSLKRYKFYAVGLQGDMSQDERVETLKEFKEGDCKIMVCSDVAARGLDLPEVSHVVNFDVPSNPEDYIHRIGRTGRAGKDGISITLTTKRDAKMLTAIEKLVGHKFEYLDIDNQYEEATGTDKIPEEKAKPQEQKGGDKPSFSGSKEGKKDNKKDNRKNNNGSKQSVKSEEKKRPQERILKKYLDNDNEQVIISEMTHPDNVLAFGDHVPAFILRKPILTKSCGGRRRKG
jgi:superfamily II DNA/RNA helicase